MTLLEKLFIALIVLTVVAAVGGLTLAAYATVTQGKCLHGHREDQVMYVMVGNVLMPMKTSVFVCDEHEEHK